MHHVHPPEPTTRRTVPMGRRPQNSSSTYLRQISSVQWSRTVSDVFGVSSPPVLFPLGVVSKLMRVLDYLFRMSAWSICGGGSRFTEGPYESAQRSHPGVPEIRRLGGRCLIPDARNLTKLIPTLPEVWARAGRSHHWAAEALKGRS